jgi:hypothetical protein
MSVEIQKKKVVCCYLVAISHHLAIPYYVHTEIQNKNKNKNKNKSVAIWQLFVTV